MLQVVAAAVVSFQIVMLIISAVVLLSLDKKVSFEIWLLIMGTAFLMLTLYVLCTI